MYFVMASYCSFVSVPTPILLIIFDFADLKAKPRRVCKAWRDALPVPPTVVGLRDFNATNWLSLGPHDVQSALSDFHRNTFPECLTPKYCEAWGYTNTHKAVDVVPHLLVKIFETCLCKDSRTRNIQYPAKHEYGTIGFLVYSQNVWTWRGRGFVAGIVLEAVAGILSSYAVQKTALSGFGGYCQAAEHACVTYRKKTQWCTTQSVNKIIEVVARLYPVVGGD
jgi:hypothetical protein